MKNYTRKSRFVNDLGYTDGATTSMNNSNQIPSNQITMGNTSQPLYGQPLDAQGYPISNPVFMEPGMNYNFNGANSVMETPVFQSGGYYPQMPMTPNPWEKASYEGLNFQGVNPMSNRLMFDPLQTQTFNGLTYPQETTPYPMNSNDQTVGGLNEWNSAYLTGEGTPSTVSTETVGGTEAVQTVDTPTNDRFQFVNPYAGMDLGGASAMLGKSIGEGNTGMSILSGLKLGTGLARNFLSGMGAAKVEKDNEAEYLRKQREAMTQSNRRQSFQDGGEVQQDPVQEVARMLSEGVSQEEVYTMLLESGVPEQDAVAIIEQASQMFKFGGMLKNQKIKNYKYNDKTGEYEVEFE